MYSTMILYLFLILPNLVLGSGVGPFMTLLNSLKDSPPQYPDLIEYLFYIQQVNISYRVMTGYMTVKNDTGPLHFKASKMLMLDGTVRQLVETNYGPFPACTNPVTVYLLKSFEPQLDEEYCSFKAGEYKLNGIDADHLVHLNGQNETPYGRAMYLLYFQNGLSQTLFSFGMDMEMVNLEHYEFAHGRGREYRRHHRHHRRGRRRHNKDNKGDKKDEEEDKKNNKDDENNQDNKEDIKKGEQS